MINTIVDLKTIQYMTKEAGFLVESIAQRGVAIAVIVKATKHGYVCVDGHKRLSACAILAKDNPKFNRIPIMILNDFSKAGSGFWGPTQNHH